MMRLIMGYSSGGFDQWRDTRARFGNRARPRRPPEHRWKDGHLLCDNARAAPPVIPRTTEEDTSVAKFKVVTPSGAGFSVPGVGYKLEMEALAPIDAEIVEIAAKTDDEFVKEARDA